MFVRLLRPRSPSQAQAQVWAIQSIYDASSRTEEASYHRSIDSVARSRSQRRRCNSTQTFHTKNGRVRIDLAKPQLVGVYQSRGERPYQEDRAAVKAIELDRAEVERAVERPPQPQAKAREGGVESTSPRRSLKQPKVAKEALHGDPSASSPPAGSNPAEAGSASLKPSDAPAAPSPLPSSSAVEQCVYVGVFDGHNGHTVSQFLADNLHSRIVSYPRSSVNDTVSRYRALGGYLRRYRAGILQDLVDQPAPAAATRSRAKPVESQRARTEKQQAKQDEKVAKAQRDREEKEWNIQQRIHASFLDADLEIIDTEQDAGAVATIALLHSLDEPRNPFFSSEELHLLIAHLGDTRALLCTAPSGEAIVLTERHHPEARSETDRLMRTRTGAVTDSFGESRWAGTLANTRGFGDAHFKQLGVFAEPAISSRVLSPAKEYAFLVLMSDGVSDMLSDQEICDLARGYQDPSKAARNIVSFAESIGGQDNLTCIVVPLPGWGTITSEDSTKKRREFRMQNYEGRSSRQIRM